MEGDLTESAVVKDNTFDSMVRFGLKMAWFNLLALVIILMVASSCLTKRRSETIS